MSKGCLLHCHLDAINEPINLLDLALKYSLETLTISSSLPLTTPENLAAAALIFNHSPCDDEIFSEAAGKKIRIYQEDYDNNTPVDVRRARLRCPLGEECFDKLIVSKLIATPESDRWSALSVWAHFQCVLSFRTNSSASSELKFIFYSCN